MVMDRKSTSQNDALFFSGIIALLVSLTLIGFSLYLLPHMLWGMRYNVPTVSTSLPHFFSYEWGFSKSFSAWLGFFCFFIPGLIAGLIAQQIERKLESEKIRALTGGNSVENQEFLANKKSWRDSGMLAMQIFLVMLGIFIIVRVLEWLVSSTPS